VQSEMEDFGPGTVPPPGELDET